MNALDAGRLVERLEPSRIVGLVVDQVEQLGCGHCFERALIDWCRPCLLGLWRALDREVLAAARSARIAPQFLQLGPRPAEQDEPEPDRGPELAEPPRPVRPPRCKACRKNLVRRMRTCDACGAHLCGECSASHRRKACPELGRGYQRVVP